MRTVPAPAIASFLESVTITRTAAGPPLKYDCCPRMCTTGVRKICEIDSVPSSAGF